MYKGYKIIPFIPAGRKERMSVLINYLLKYRNNPIDEVYLWRNTQNPDDLAYIDSLKGDYFKVFDILSEPNEVFTEPKQLNTGKYYRYTTDPNTIYIRFDDDIVFVDDQYFTNILDFRINNPQYFLVFGNIWNNAIISYLHQRFGHLSSEHGIVEKDFCMDEVGWRSPFFAEYIHKVLQEKINTGKTSDLFFNRWELHNAKRFSISNFAFFGSDFAQFNGVVKFTGDIQSNGYVQGKDYHALDEEIWLTEHYPSVAKKLNVICGSALCCHFSFLFQRDHLMGLGMLDWYKKLSEDRLQQSYYQFIEK